MDSSSISQDMFGRMREAHHKIQNQAHNIESELQEVYARKEQIEADLANRRQVTAANEALERDRSELPHNYSRDSEYRPVESSELSQERSSRRSEGEPRR